MRFRIAVSFALLVVCVAAFADTKSVTIFQDRKLAVDVPEGWTYDATSDPNTGVQTLMIEQADGVKVLASFLPDPENRLANKDALATLMKQAFGPMLEGAVEKEVKVSYAEATDGFEGHTVFTDKQWVGKKDIPATERRFATAAIRRWPGVMAMVTILSDDLDSPAYAQALRVLREGIRQVSK